MLKYNPDTKVIFDNDEAAVAPIREITRDEIPDLIADGAGVDASANVGEQTSSAVPTAGDVQAVQDPAVPVIGSDTGADAGKIDAAPAEAAPVDTSATTYAPAAVSGETPVAGDTGNADAVVAGSPNATAASDASFASSVDTQPAGAASSTSVSTESTADAVVDAPEPVVTDAQADPGGAGSADLSPTPAAPNLDAQAQSSAVPLAAGGDADVSVDSTAAAQPSEEHPLTIIGEIEELVRMVGNAAVHEYQRLIQRLADLKNHPAIKDE
ncbi:hypothetical protein QCE63_32185 [Caballeronia sp. LZ065]|uniref:hypothetical protein n=1 Tax=Caballeronia sp. LZ065 TaxID=3038571 RepID=UPI00285DA97C|nr:hypothetical protein [Caballeronia sp. LZ065]MDR5784081.1 hypothetical protein [Caballeronia sp. LZ065]